ncbi:hypothetical protein, partial [Nocardia amikacinitolerans]|uniref:hypothetical protein n=1 Tax=Nocardia amikacinitolerans TaxID=756689 RepID=UPI0020A4C394
MCIEDLRTVEDEDLSADVCVVDQVRRTDHRHRTDEFRTAPADPGERQRANPRRSRPMPSAMPSAARLPRESSALAVGRCHRQCPTAARLPRESSVLAVG